MPWKRAKKAVLVSAIALPTIVKAIPHIQFPINSQVPPVARVSQPYAFTFAESTFTSAAGPITYELSDEPQWLQLDSGTRAFSGRPGPDDVGSATFRVIATDAQGHTPLSVTLVVVLNESLEACKSLSSQLAGFGVPSNPSSLLFYPLQPFAFHFSLDTFLRTSSSTIYYAVSQDNSPLPSWLEFDASNLGFAGTTPPLVSPTAKPQTFGVKLVASDVPGFLEASTAFQIVVGYHILAFSMVNETINAGSGRAEIRSSPLRDTLKLDGKAVTDTELVLVTANAPSWLLLDQENISLSGIPPADATNLSVTISAMDVLGDTANATIEFTFTSNLTRLFLGGIPVANATIGQSFNYTISRGLLAPGNITLTADLGSSSAWLTFDPNNLSFTGKVPPHLTPGQTDIALYAALGDKRDEGNLLINIIRGAATPSPTYTTTVTAPAKSRSSSSVASFTSPATTNYSPPSRSTKMKIVLAAVLSTVVLILLVVLFICCWQRKQKAQYESNAMASEQIPTPTAAEHEEPALLDAATVDSGPNDEKSEYAAPNEPPRVELSWAPDSLRRAKVRLSRRISARDGNILNLSFANSPFKDMESPAHHYWCRDDGSQQYSERGEELPQSLGTRISNFSQRTSPFWSTQSKTEEEFPPKRASKVLCTISTVTSGLPSRLSGAGHGAGRAGPLGFVDIQSSWQDNESSLPNINSKGTALDIVQKFPQPPVEAGRMRRLRSPQRARKASVRLVATSSSHTDSLIDERQRWHTERARDPAWSSRPDSGCQRLDANNPSPVHYDQFNPFNGPCGQSSEYAGLAVTMQPEIKPPCRGPGRPLFKPTPNLTHEDSRASSGQFDSALSTSSSQWEDEIFTTEVDLQEEEARHPADNNARREDQDAPLQCPQLRATTTHLNEVSSPGGLEIFRASRTSRLRDAQGHRYVLTGEGNLQKAERGHQGSLAFL